MAKSKKSDKTEGQSEKKTTKSAELLKAEKANKAAKDKAKKEKKESVAAAKAAAAASIELEKAQKEQDKISYSKMVTTAYSKAWKREELIAYVKENYEDVKPFEMNNKQIAFIICGTRVPSEGYFTVS